MTGMKRAPNLQVRTLSYLRREGQGYEMAS
jgi:hypothetical protein